MVSEPPTEPAVEPTRSRPSRAWYIAAVVPFLLSLIPAYWLGQAAADEVEVHLDVLPDRAVELDEDDRSIYATSQDVSEQARCALRSVTGQTVSLDESVTHLATEQDGATWYRVVPLPSNIEAGTYALRCRAGGEEVDPTSLAVSTSPRWGRFAVLLIAAFGIPVAAAVLGTLIVVAIIVVRRRRTQDADDDQPSSVIQFE